MFDRRASPTTFDLWRYTEQSSGVIPCETSTVVSRRLTVGFRVGSVMGGGTPLTLAGVGTARSREGLPVRGSGPLIGHSISSGGDVVPLISGIQNVLDLLVLATTVQVFGLTVRE